MPIIRVTVHEKDNGGVVEMNRLKLESRNKKVALFGGSVHSCGGKALELGACGRGQAHLHMVETKASTSRASSCPTRLST